MTVAHGFRLAGNFNMNCAAKTLAFVCRRHRCRSAASSRDLARLRPRVGPAPRAGGIAPRSKPVMWKSGDSQRWIPGGSLSADRIGFAPQ